MGDSFLNVQMEKLVNDGLKILGGSSISIDTSDIVNALNLIASKISGGGGSGEGSTVSITPTITDGTKIADFTIDQYNGSLYAPNTSGINYSTDEQDTGLTWIDGKKIYQKSVEVNIPNTDFPIIQHNITGLENVINYETSCMTGGFTLTTRTHLPSGTLYVNAIDSENITLYNGGYFTGSAFVITIQYTKNE